jgi:hypothetical protein
MRGFVHVSGGIKIRPHIHRHVVIHKVPVHPSRADLPVEVTSVHIPDRKMLSIRDSTHMV